MFRTKFCRWVMERWINFSVTVNFDGIGRNKEHNGSVYRDRVIVNPQIRRGRGQEEKHPSRAYDPGRSLQSAHTGSGMLRSDFIHPVSKKS